MNQHSDDSTIQYYDENALEFIETTIALNLESLYKPFLELIPPGGSILDAGCGSGRDTKVFKNLGYDVTAIDASTEMVRATTEYSGVIAKQIRFQELDFDKEFDGIWACASLLHVPLSDFDDALNRMARALKKEGALYCSFKYGSGERIKDERRFTDFTEKKLQDKIIELNSLRIMKLWYTSDVRPSKDERWVNCICKKMF